MNNEIKCSHCGKGIDLADYELRLKERDILGDINEALSVAMNGWSGDYTFVIGLGLDAIIDFERAIVDSYSRNPNAMIPPPINMYRGFRVKYCDILRPNVIKILKSYENVKESPAYSEPIIDQSSPSWTDGVNDDRCEG